VQGDVLRRAAKIDANQPAIVNALRLAGAHVLDLSRLGGGCPDILAEYRGRWLLLEIKDGTRKPSERRLTEMEARFHQIWGERVRVVESLEQAFEVMGVRVGK